MAKRGADSDLTKNNWEEEADGEEPVNEGGFVEASSDKLAGRTFVKVRRKGEDSTAEESKTEETKTPSEAPAIAEPAKNPFFALLDPTDWECPTCEVRNKKALVKCAACEAPKPGTAPAAAGTEGVKAPDFNFGFATTPFTFGSTTSGVTFGSATTWGFGATSTDTSTSTETSSTTTSTGWSFTGTTDSPFTFGSGATVTFGDVSGTGFGTGAPTAFETTDQLATGGDQTKEEFKNKEPEPSGTEKDVTLFKIPTTVYLLSKVESKEEGAEKKEAMKFVECGEGELKINTVQDADKKFARVVLRVEKTQRLVLNAPLFTGMTLGLQGEKYVKFCSNDPEGKVAVYLLKFKNKTESTQVKDHMEKAIAFTAN